MLWIPRFARTAALAQSFKLDRKEAWKTARVAPQSGDPIFRRRQHTQPANACPLTDSSLKGTGFELPVRGRGQSGCRPFYAAESSGRVGAPLSVFGQHDALHQSGVDPTAEAAILQTGITADVYMTASICTTERFAKRPTIGSTCADSASFCFPGTRRRNQILHGVGDGAAMRPGLDGKAAGTDDDVVVVGPASLP
jgi:hypothetical protein